MQFSAKYRDDGTVEVVAVDDWDRETWVSFPFLFQSDPKYMSFCDDDFIITVSNGKARYKIIERDPERQRVFATLVESELDIPNVFR